MLVLNSAGTGKQTDALVAFDSYRAGGEFPSAGSGKSVAIWGAIVVIVVISDEDD